MSTVEIHTDEQSAAIIQTQLERLDLQNHCTIYKNDHSTDINMISASFQKKFSHPAHLGEILDEVIKQIQKSETQKTRFLDIAGSSLDTHHATLTHPAEISSAQQSPIQLTEKESEILAILARADKHTISRDNLLQNIWNYAENVETHTLETHIYRLRQKIEQDPATPKILLTTELGYKIGTKNY